ncbi:hypothetical protein RyT2_25060 [Pseudolactococcus yaeyamensis]
MKHIKLLSVVALAVFGATAASSVVSAAPVLDRQTGGSIEFDNATNDIDINDPEKPDVAFPTTEDPKKPIELIQGPAGGLFLGGVPDTFNFGKHEIGATDIFSGKVLTYEQEKRPSVTRKQGVAVYDGRIDKDDWSLSAKLSAFNTGKLKGTTITIENAKTLSQFPNQQPKLVQGSKTTISQTTSVEFLKSDPKAKGTTSALWDKFSDVKINVPASEITKGAHKATVDWTLVAGAN